LKCQRCCYFILGHEPDADLGPVISPQSKQRIHELVESGIQEGAKILLDGRGIKVPGYEKGNFVGPTVLSDVKVRKSVIGSKYIIQTLKLYVVTNKCILKYDSLI